MYYGEPVIRKTVLLALSLLNASNPQLSILDRQPLHSMCVLFELGVVSEWVGGLASDARSVSR